MVCKPWHKVGDQWYNIYLGNSVRSSLCLDPAGNFCSRETCSINKRYSVSAARGLTEIYRHDRNLMQEEICVKNCGLSFSGNPLGQALSCAHLQKQVDRFVNKISQECTCLVFLEWPHSMEVANICILIQCCAPSIHIHLGRILMLVKAKRTSRPEGILEACLQEESRRAHPDRGLGTIRICCLETCIAWPSIKIFISCATNTFGKGQDLS